jgi:hypothetical protein
MGRTKRLTPQELNPDSLAMTDVLPTSLYWLGMLPAQETFKLKRPTREKDAKTGDYYTYEDTTSQELWEGEVNQWVGRCRWKQSLSVNGITFDAFTETLMRPVGAQGGTLNKISWPGSIAEQDEERFKHIVEQCYRNVIRLRQNVGTDICIDQPKSYMMLDNGTEKSTKEGYNPRTDTFFAHYVYILKLDANPQEYDQGTYYRLASSWDDFFKKSPQSVAEMYPLKDGKVEFGKAEEA